VNARGKGKCPECGRVLRGRRADDAGEYVALPAHNTTTRPGPKTVCLPRYSRRVVRRIPDNPGTAPRPARA
jgi:hypothetical protein